ncbi:MAG: hypothetical protein AAGC95_11070 [Pseudomonadota bacterium]
MLELARRGVADLIASYDDPKAPYLSQPRPQFQNAYGDYDHLARRKEWAAAAGEEA